MKCPKLGRHLERLDPLGRPVWAVDALVAVRSSGAHRDYCLQCQTPPKAHVNDNATSLGKDSDLEPIMHELTE